MLAVAAAKDVEADVIKAVEAAIATRPSRQGTISGLVVFVSCMTLCMSACLCACLCVLAKLHSPYGTPVKLAKHLSRTPASVIRTCTKATRTPVYATQTPKCIGRTSAAAKGHAVNRTPAGMSRSMAVCRTRVSWDRTLAPIVQSRTKTNYMRTSATVESAPSAVTSTAATTHKIQADGVSDSSRATSSGVVESGLQTLTAAARRPIRNVARRPVRDFTRRPVRDIARRQVTNVSWRAAICNKVPESCGKSSAQGGFTRRKRRAMDN